MTATETRLYAFAVGHARFRHRLYFAADSTAARELGVSRRTIIRCRQSLERKGWLERTGYQRWGKLPTGHTKYTVCYRFPRRRVTRGSSSRSSRVSSLRSDTRRLRAESQHLNLKGGTLPAPDQMRLDGDDSPKRSRRRPDVVWDAASAVWGPPGNDAERGRRSRAVKLIRQSLASDGIPEAQAEAEIRARCARYVEQYRHIPAPSDVALASRWSDCKPPRKGDDGLSAYTRA